MADTPELQSLDDAVGWCLSERDSGNTVSVELAIETFPHLETELRQFFDQERQLVNLVSPNAAPKSPPPQIAQYELRAELGSGSFGMVHRAWDTKMHREVAIKTPRHLVGDDKARERFLREARTAGQLAHPNIVRTIEVGEFEHMPFIVSEIVDGESLKSWMKKPSAPRTAARVALRMASGLEHAHQRGVIHRDLTPNNVLLDANDKPYILDFGLAKSLQTETTVTIVGDVIGTPAYVSPEQVSGAGHEVDARTDIYSLGAILYEMLTGERPFDGDLKLLLHRIQYEQPKPPATLNPNVPSLLSKICCKCIEKDPAERYQSAKSLIADLDSFLAEDGSSTFASDTTGQGGNEFSTSTNRWKSLLWIAGICAIAISFVAFSRAFMPTTHTASDSNLAAKDHAAITNDHGIKTSRSERPTILQGHQSTVASAHFRGDGLRFVSCGHGGRVIAWDWKTGEELWRTDIHDDEIWSVDWSPDGKTIATASKDNTSLILDADSGELLRAFEGHTAAVCCVQFSPDGKSIATAGLDGTVRIWNPDTAQELERLPVEGAEFVNCRFNAAGNTLVATGWKGRLAKWDLVTKKLEFVKTAHKAAAWTVCFMPHESAIATAGEDGFIRLWDEATGSLLREQKAATSHVTCVRAHPNGRQIMHSSHDKTICIWDPLFESIESEFRGHEHWIYEFVIHPTGQEFVSTSVDQTIRIWNLDDAISVASAPPEK